MKRINILYWIFTLLFVAFMMFSVVSELFNPETSKRFMAEIGYPAYLSPFLGVAKTLGCIALLLPGWQRLKEWAYAGLFFDLIGATYSQLAVYGWMSSMLFMLLPFGLGICSYYFHHKKLTKKQTYET